MARRLSILFLSCLLLLLPACGEKPAFDLDTLRPPMERSLNTFPGLSMEVKDIHPSHLTVRVTLDDTLPRSTFTCGEDFWLDDCFQGQWYAAPLAEGKVLGFNGLALSLTLRPGIPRVLPELPYYSFYGALPPGLYRVVKSYSRGYGQEREEFYLSAEFEIQEDTFS